MFPSAHYLIGTSRLHPGVDGGYTVAVMRRAKAFRAQGGVNPTLLTVDFSPEYPQSLAGFRQIGLADEHTVLRNLYQEARGGAAWLWSAADPALLAQQTPPSEDLSGSTDLDSAGIPWRTTWRSPQTGTIAYTDYLDSQGRPLIRTPYIARADWHRADDVITVFRDGQPLGGVSGFGGLYRAWVASVIAELDPALPTILISESRQLGELLPPLRSKAVALIHTVHSAHVLAPYRWDSPIDALWQGWLDAMANFDAVVWLTMAQRDDVARRFGTPTVFAVIPHPAEPPTQVLARPASTREENRAVMVTRLVPVKQVDHAIRAFAEVGRGNPLARLDIYGDGPLRADLEALIVSLGLTGVVRLHGYQADAADELDDAAVLVMCSSYEGQSLVIAEAFARGCPAIAYDVNYGPREMIVDGKNGYLVLPGDTHALAVATAMILGEPKRQKELSAGAAASAARMTVDGAMARWSRLFEQVLSELPGRPTT